MLMLAREIFTVFCFLAFLGVVYFAYNKRSASVHESVGRSIIEDDDNEIMDLDDGQAKR